MTRLTCLVLLLAAPGWGRAADPDALPAAVELWPGGAPSARGDSAEDRPAVYPFLPDPAKSTGAAVVVCPGGGFMTRCGDHEGAVVARWLADRGVAGFVLRYRLRPLYTQADAVRDGRRAVQHVRANATQYKVAADRVGAIGFSAGAALVAAASADPPPADPAAADPLDRQPGRPDFQVLVYGSAPTPKPADDRPPPPPTFLFCTAEDAGALRGMLDLYADLRRARVPAEAHFFERGEHGVALAPGDPVLGGWPDLMFNWVRAGGFLTGAKRVAVRGLVTVDGAPLPHGAVVFTPDDPAAPPVTAYVLNSGPVRGGFTIPAGRGPTPGRYRVAVHQDAARWAGNAQDPVIGPKVAKLRAGTLTADERREWEEHARKRDLSPALAGVRVFRRGKPTDPAELTVEVRPGAELVLNLDVATK